MISYGEAGGTAPGLPVSVNCVSPNPGCYQSYSGVLAEKEVWTGWTTRRQEAAASLCPSVRPAGILSDVGIPFKAH